MTTLNRIQVLEDAFLNELEKIAACRRENAHKRVNRTRTRSGKRPIRAEKLIKSAMGPGQVSPYAMEVLRNPYFWGIMTGVGGTMGAQSMAKDYTMGRKVRKMQKQQAKMR